MKYMLDTNTCIFIIKQKPEAVIKHFLTLKPDDVCISSITYAELCHGVEKSKAKDKNRLALALFLANIPILFFDDKSSEAYGEIKTQLESEGVPIGPMDMLIAAHAKSKSLTLVTNNTREFKRVKALRLEDWVC